VLAMRTNGNNDAKRPPDASPDWHLPRCESGKRSRVLRAQISPYSRLVRIAAAISVCGQEQKTLILLLKRGNQICFCRRHARDCFLKAGSAAGNELGRIQSAASTDEQRSANCDRSPAHGRPPLTGSDQLGASERSSPLAIYYRLSNHWYNVTTTLGLIDRISTVYSHADRDSAWCEAALSLALSTHAGET